LNKRGREGKKSGKLKLLFSKSRKLINPGAKNPRLKKKKKRDEAETKEVYKNSPGAKKQRMRKNTAGNTETKKE